MKNKKYAYLWEDLSTGILKFYNSLRELSEAQDIPYHVLNDEFGPTGIQTYQLAEHQEVRQVPLTRE